MFSIAERSHLVYFMARVFGSLVPRLFIYSFLSVVLVFLFKYNICQFYRCHHFVKLFRLRFETHGSNLLKFIAGCIVFSHLSRSSPKLERRSLSLH